MTAAKRGPGSRARAGSRRDRRIEQDLVKLTERVDALELRVPADE